jgi:dTDP-4-amino-4,6-dideoxygalactose transaminase
VTTPIHHTFGPLALQSQVLQAFRLQFQPWLWQHGPSREELRTALAKQYSRNVHVFDSGRSALWALLTALELQPGDEVILQGFTCAVVPNAIRAAGGTPIYVDISQRTLGLDPSLVRSAITRRTRAVICQHTFGIPSDTSALRIICDESDIALIEDCAHILPEQLSDRIGLHADAVLLSFGRDKAISGVSGGAVLTQHAFIAQRLDGIEKSAATLSKWEIFTLVCYPLRYATAKFLWPVHLGRLYLRIVRFFRLLPPVLTAEERRGIMTARAYALPNACAAMALLQFQQLRSINAHRHMLSERYAAAVHTLHAEVPRAAASSPALQKFPLLLPNAERIRRALKRQDIHLDDGWCGAVVNPRTTDQRAAGYPRGTCPESERIASHILSLPTHPTMTVKDADRLLAALEKLLHT